MNDNSQIQLQPWKFQLDGCIKNNGDQVLNFNYTFCFFNEAN